MSKYSSLVKKIEVFDKLASFEDKLEFLQSLGQELGVEDKLKAAVSTLYTNIQNWIKNSAERQSDVPGTPEHGLPIAMREPVQMLVSVLKSNNYDLDTLPNLKSAVLGLMNVANLGNLNQESRSAWTNSVFHQAGNVADLVEKQIKFLNEWRTKNLPPEETPPNQNSSQETTKQTQPKLNQLSKSVSQNLSNKVQKLSNGPDRQTQLKEVELGVKTLQNYFKRLQNSNNLKDYFARIDIINTLNKVYNSLDDKDLQTVNSLGPNGSGIPENPDAKI